ncbi:hypothetical protein RCL_jg16365.t1 [Rhizophagus clarus]|uniref:Uncharacterized protein n=1 Tax=Rhizophagus clarus TaxID=94130 RepID=A0A8H3M5U1_9GLOM|nr:hypothetical protein RCL_jg16365.t1 [Rhizophagus clarus]
MLSNNLLDFPINIIHHQKIINRSIQRQRRRIMRRTYRRFASSNNANMTLSQIAQLPLQVTNNPFAIQLFHGTSFR